MSIVPSTKTNVFRLVRLARDLKAKDIADMMPCSSTYVFQVETGERYPSEKWIERFCELLEVPVEVIKHFSSNSAGRFEKRMLELLQEINEADDKKSVELSK